MGDLYRETMRWIARVTNSGYMISVMWECEWGNHVKENSEIKEHIESYSLSSPLTPREALYWVDAKHLVCMRVVLTHL